MGPTLIKQLREGKRTGLEDEGPRMPGFGQRGGGVELTKYMRGSKGLGILKIIIFNQHLTFGQFESSSTNYKFLLGWLWICESIV